jgi:hypothetical protein
VKVLTSVYNINDVMNVGSIVRSSFNPHDAAFFIHSSHYIFSRAERNGRAIANDIHKASPKVRNQ